MLYLLLKSPQLGACSQPPSTSCPSPPLISAMQTAQQHARGSGARPALSLLTASRATPSRHAPGAVAEQEVLLDPLQRLAGIGELVAALRSLRFCSASSAFSCFFPTWPPGSPAPVPRQPRSRTGRLFYMAIRLCSGAAHASQPRPAGPRPPRAALAPPPALGRRPLCTLAALRPRLLPLAQQVPPRAVARLRRAQPVPLATGAAQTEL